MRAAQEEDTLSERRTDAGFTSAGGVFALQRGCPGDGGLLTEAGELRERSAPPVSLSLKPLLESR